MFLLSFTLIFFFPFSSQTEEGGSEEAWVPFQAKTHQQGKQQEDHDLWSHHGWQPWTTLQLVLQWWRGKVKCGLHYFFISSFIYKWKVFCDCNFMYLMMNFCCPLRRFFSFEYLGFDFLLQTFLIDLISMTFLHFLSAKRGSLASALSH